MKTYLSILLLMLSSITHSYSQITAFIEDYNKVYQSGFQSDRIEFLHEKYNHIFFWYNASSQLAGAMKGAQVAEYPLEGFRDSSLYQESIDLLLTDTSYHKKMLGSSLVCAAKDTSRLHHLKVMLQDYDHRYVWTAVHHILLSPKEIGVILDFIAHNKEQKGIEHFLGYFYRLDPGVLSDFGMKNIYSTNDVWQALALRSLKFSPLDGNKEALIREAITKLPLDRKGWAISLSAHFQLNNMLAEVKPYLNLDTLRLMDVSYRALAASSSATDGDYLYKLVLEEDSISKKYFPHLLLSPQSFNVHKALELLIEKLAVSDLYFSTSKQSLLKEDQFLEKIHDLLDKVTDNNILTKFIPLLHNRFDEKSTQLLLYFLKHDRDHIRQLAAQSIINNPSPVYTQQLVNLATDTDRPNFSLVANLIHLNIDTLQSFYEKVYHSNDGKIWHWDKVQAFDYLMEYPLSQQKSIFREILIENDEKEYSKRRKAAMALGRLKDEESVSLIIASSNRERAGNDGNCLSYIYALEMIKGDTALQEIRSFENSEEPLVREKVREILANW